MSHLLRTTVLLTVGATALGAQTPKADSTRPARLPLVTTTASRYAAPPDSLPRRVEVVSRAQIDATPALDVVDLLKKRATLDVVQFPGLLGGIGIRGFRPQAGSLQSRTLVLLDGRPSGITNLSLLDLQDIERIEVLKGPGSSLYGSSAMGGVVNVVTRRRSGALSGLVSAQAGSFGATEFRVQGGGTLVGGIDADVSLRRYDQRDDFRIGDGTTLRDVFGRDTVLKIYPTGARPNRFVSDTLGAGLTRVFTAMATTSGNLRVGGTIGSRVRVDVRGDLFDAQDLPSPGDLYAAATAFPGNSRKNLTRTGGSVELGGTLAGNALLARGYTTTELSEYFNQPDGARFVNFNTTVRTTGLQLQDVLRPFGQQLVIGLDANEQKATSQRFSAANVETGTFSPNSKTTSLAAFTEARVTALAGRLIATAGARADRITLALLPTPLRTDVRAGEDDFTVFNPSAGLLFNIGGGVRAHGSVGRAFLAPDAFGRAGLTQAVTGGVAAITFGNPTLKPEHSVTADVGLGVTRVNGAFDLDVTYFTTDVTNRITSARASFAAGARPALANGTQVSRVTTNVNAGDATIRGLEAAVRYDIGAVLRRRWSLNATANVTRIFEAVERTPTVTVNAAQFNGQTNFSPSSIFSGVQIGGPFSSLGIKNVASATWNVGLEFDDRRRFRAGVLGRYVGVRTDNDFSDFSDISDIEYPPFATVDLTAGVRLTQRFRLDGQINNVTDENYYEKRGYNLPGRAFSLRVTTLF